MKALLQIYPGDHILWLSALLFLQSTGVIMLTRLMAQGVARHRPAVRHGIWFWALVSLLLGPFFVSGVERAGLSLLILPSPRSLVASPPPIIPLEVRGAGDDRAGSPRPDWAAKLPIRIPRGEPAGKTPHARVGHSAADGLRAAGAVAFVLWLLGAAFLLARLAVGWFFLERLKGEAWPLDEELLPGILSEVREALGTEVLPPILVSERLDRPVAAGLFRAAVILPATLLKAVDPLRLRDVLVHECAHVRRRDHLIGLLQRLAEVGYWPQPLIQLLNRELSRAREELCDNHVLRGGDRIAYSWTLLEVTEIATGPAQFPTAFGLLSASWKLEDRIAGILDERRDLMTKANRRASLLVMAVYLTATALFAGLSPRASAQKQQDRERVAAAPGGPAEIVAAPLLASSDRPSRDATPGAGPDISDAVNRMAERLKQGPAERTPEPDRLALFLMDVASGEATLIVDEPERGRKYCGSPRWSPDGRRILFDATPGNDWSLTHLKSINLAEARLEVTDLGPGNCPTFSPDGKRIAFLVNGGAAPELRSGVWVMQADGTERRRLGGFGIPKWSPDGRKLLIVHFGSPVRMGIMDVETGQERPLNIPGYQIHSSPSWADAGTLVAAASSDEGTAVALYDVSDPDQVKVKEVLWKKGDRLDVNPSYPVYSPVTRRCVFVGREPKGKALYSVQQGSFGPPKRLEPADYDNQIASLEYSPDGRYVLFCSDRPDRRPRGVAR